MQVYIAIFSTIIFSGCADQQSCRINTVGNLKVINDSGPPIIEALIDEHRVSLIVDTGSSLSVIWPDKVKELGLELTSSKISTYGAGGNYTAGVAIAHSLRINNSLAADVSFLVGGALVGSRPVDGVPTVGVLGQDFLAQYDIHFNLPERSISLLQRSGCEKEFAQWTEGHEEDHIAHDSAEPTKLTINIEIDHTPIRAILDSGARRSLVPTDYLRLLNISPSELNRDMIGEQWGLDGKVTRKYLHKFTSLDIGTYHIDSPLIDIGSFNRAILGSDFFWSTSIWLPRDQSRIFVRPVHTVVFGPPLSAPPSKAVKSKTF